MDATTETITSDQIGSLDALIAPAPDPFAATTRGEAEGLERAKGFRCRGRLPDDAREDVVMLLRTGRHDEACQIDNTRRVSCGSDGIERTICAGRFDGEYHTYTCPDCGATGQYRAPFYNDACLEPVEPAPADAAPEAAQ